MNPPARRTAHGRHHRLVAIIGLLPAIAGFVVLPWESAQAAFLVVWLVVGSIYLCYLVWALATGRVGLIHWAPTARRQRRLAARAAAEEAGLEQQRLSAAMSYGSYRPTAGRAQVRDPGQAG